MTTATACVMAECATCDEAARRYAADGTARVCDDCGAVHGPDEPTLPPRTSHVGLTASARVQVADEARLRPSSTPPAARLTRVEGLDEVRVRSLLCELRPDASGPLGWSPLGSPTGAYGSGWVTAERVQVSVEVPAILPGAFRSDAPRSPGAEVADRIAGMAREHPDEAAALGWLQRTGSLAEGLRGLYLAAALALAPERTREAWKAMAEPHRMPARLGYGARRVEAAAAMWWGEGERGTVAT